MPKIKAASGNPTSSAAKQAGKVLEANAGLAKPISSYAMTSNLLVSDFTSPL